MWRDGKRYWGARFHAWVTKGSISRISALKDSLLLPVGKKIALSAEQCMPRATSSLVLKADQPGPFSSNGGHVLTNRILAFTDSYEASFSFGSKEEVA